jgi:hypothetical protein
MTRMTDTNLVERAQKAAQFELNIALELGHYETAERMQTIIDALRFQRAALSRKEGVEPEPVAWQWRYRYSDNEWGPWQVERRPDADDLLAGNVLMAEEKRPLYASPAPSVQPVVKGLDDLIAEFERLRDKHSSPTGDEYTCGAWDAAQRLICVARRLSALAPAPVPADMEKAVDVLAEHLEIDWDGDEPFVRSDSIETALLAASPYMAREGWRPISEAPRDGRWVWLWNKHADPELAAQRFRWSTHYSVFGLGGCWTDGLCTMGDGVDFDFWRESLPADFAPPAAPTDGGRADG